jgi:hypothetical protein
MRFSIKMIAAPLALAAAQQAQAAHVVLFGPNSEAYVVSGTGDSNASAYIVNGNAPPLSNTAGAGATSTTASLAPNGTTASANTTTTSAAVPGRTSNGFSYSSLDTGILRSQLFQTPPTAFGFPGGDSQARIADTVFFTNTSGQAVNLDLIFSFDGTAFTFSPNSATGTGLLTLGGGCGGCGNNLNQYISYLGSGSTVGTAINAVFNENGVYNVYDQFSGQALNPLDFSVLNNMNGISSTIRATIVIPTGDTSLGFNAGLFLRARDGASMDFGNTARFGFGALPSGLSYTSASGVFLKGLPGSAGAVPEPATWAMMLVGFGLVGFAMRGRTRTARTSFV